MSRTKIRLGRTHRGSRLTRLATAGLFLAGLAASSATAATIQMPDDAFGQAGGTVSIPIRALPADGILGADIRFLYNPAVLTPTGATATIISSGFSVTANFGVPGRVILSLFGTVAMAGSGSIVDVQFNVIGAPGATSTLDLTLASLNEDKIPAVLADGLFTVCAAVPLEVAAVSFAAGPSRTMQWASQGGGARYDVAGALLAALLGPGASSAACIENDVPTNSWTDPRPSPASGTGNYYIVRAQNVCGAGTYGAASSGAQRFPGIDCP